MLSKEFLLGNISPPRVKHSVGVACSLCLGLKFRPVCAGPARALGAVNGSWNILTNPGPSPLADLKRAGKQSCKKGLGKLLHSNGSCVQGRQKELGCSCRKGKGSFTAEHEVQLGLSQ